MRPFRSLLLRPLLSCAIAACAMTSLGAFAQSSADTYPTRPITIVVPFAAGGPADIEARLYTPMLTRLLGQSMVIDYKVGAGTSIGTGYVAKAAPDGYTLLTNTAGFAILPTFYKLPFDLIKDLAPISLMSTKTSILIVPASSPFKNFTEYLAYAKANPGKINYGTSGAGALGHLTAEWLHADAGVKVTFVHFKGNSTLMNDLVAGRVDIGSSSTITAFQLMKQGKARALAVKGPSRLQLMPDLPSVSEYMKGYRDLNWQGFFAPGATPAPIINKLAGAFQTVAKDPELAKKMEALESDMVGSSPEEFRKLLVTEVARWRDLVARFGIEKPNE